MGNEALYSCDHYIADDNVQNYKFHHDKFEFNLREVLGGYYTNSGTIDEKTFKKVMDILHENQLARYTGEEALEREYDSYNYYIKYGRPDYGVLAKKINYDYDIIDILNYYVDSYYDTDREIIYGDSRAKKCVDENKNQLTIKKWIDILFDREMLNMTSEHFLNTIDERRGTRILERDSYIKYIRMQIPTNYFVKDMKEIILSINPLNETEYKIMNDLISMLTIVKKYDSLIYPGPGTFTSEEAEELRSALKKEPSKNASIETPEEETRNWKFLW